MNLLASLLAVAIGISLGLLGGGGSILAVPVLSYVVGLQAKEAIATSLVVVGSTSFVGVLRHWPARNIDLRASLLFGLTSMCTAYLGSRIAAFIAGWVQLTVFGVVMLAAAIAMLWGRTPAEHETGRASTPAIVLAAAGTGLLTGIVGIGGGFLILPALVVFAHLPMKRAVGTSLLVITMNSAAAFAGYAGRVAISVKTTTLFTLAAFIGVAIGAALVSKVSTPALRRAFAVLLLFVAGFVLYRNASQLFL